jgi:hypothetical protein
MSYTQCKCHHQDLVLTVADITFHTSIRDRWTVRRTVELENMETISTIQVGVTRFGNTAAHEIVSRQYLI